MNPLNLVIRKQSSSTRLPSIISTSVEALFSCGINKLVRVN